MNGTIVETGTDLTHWMVDPSEGATMTAGRKLRVTFNSGVRTVTPADHEGEFMLKVKKQNGPIVFKIPTVIKNEVLE